MRSLDGLRGLLAVYVLAGHSRWLLWTGHANWTRQPHAWWENILAYASASLRYGHEAVMVFFVLSGFFIHLRTSQQLAYDKEVKFNASDYFARRIHRLIPPYALALLLTLVVDAFGHHFWPVLYEGRTGDALLDSNVANKGYSAAAVIPALLLLPVGLGKDFGSNGPLWSLGFEAVYYAVYPLWLRLRLTIGRAAFVVVAILSPLAFLLAAKGFLFNVVGHYYLWIAGAGCAELVCRRRLPQWVGLGLLVVLLGGILGRVLFNSAWLLLVVNLALGVGAVAVFGLLPKHWSKSRLFRVWEFLGIRSYTIYICHFPLLVLLSAWVIQVGGGRPMHGWLALIGGLVVLAVTLLCFELVERHFLHARLRLAPELVEGASR